MSKKYTKKRRVGERGRGEEKKLGKGDSKNRTAKKKNRTNFVRRAQSRASKANPKVRPDAKLISFFAREVMAPVKFALLLFAN